MKQVRVILHEQREDAAGISVVFAGIAKDVVFFTVAVEIKTKVYPRFFDKSSYFLFDIEYLGMQCFGRFFPSAI